MSLIALVLAACCSQGPTSTPIPGDQFAAFWDHGPWRPPKYCYSPPYSQSLAILSSGRRFCYNYDMQQGSTDPWYPHPLRPRAFWEKMSPGPSFDGGLPGDRFAARGGTHRP